MSRSRSYTELRQLPTFDERFDYLVLHGHVGDHTFGHARWVNQHFYSSHLWHQARRQVIIRDDGCDLGIPGYDVFTDLVVHHMNPITVRDIEDGEAWILDPEYLITTSKNTHNAIHYGGRGLLPRPSVPRNPGDTRLW